MCLAHSCHLEFANVLIALELDCLPESSAHSVEGIIFVFTDVFVAI